jgi:hypothetical protein
MNTLHLISDDRIQHTVHIDGGGTGACDTAIEHLKSEACGTKNHIIICDKNNMPLTYLTFASSPEPSKLDDIDNYTMVAVAVAVLILYMIIT